MAGISFAPDEAARIDNMVKDGQSKVLLQQSVADAKMSALMGQALEQKESIIKALQDELSKERSRRREMGRDYSTQIKEFEKDKKAIEVLKKKSEKLELKQQTAERKQDAELDMVPTK